MGRTETDSIRRVKACGEIDLAVLVELGSTLCALVRVFGLDIACKGQLVLSQLGETGSSSREIRIPAALARGERQIVTLARPELKDTVGEFFGSPALLVFNGYSPTTTSSSGRQLCARRGKPRLVHVRLANSRSLLK